MQQKEEQLKSHVLGKKITDIEFYNINDNYYVFDPENTWVFDAGVQMKFGENTLSFGFNATERGMDYSLEKPMEDLLEGSDFYTVDAKQNVGVAALIGLEVLDLEIVWAYYFEYDENFELKDEKIYMPAGLHFKLSNDKLINVALLQLSVTQEPFSIAKAKYSLDGGLYVSLKNNLEIEPLETEETNP